jgi:hypothetical protein
MTNLFFFCEREETPEESRKGYYTKTNLRLSKTQLLSKHTFFALTYVLIGKGNKASFCCSSWINGVAAGNIAPSLYKKACRKKINVEFALKKIDG